jgi:hypothetical protein
MPKAALDNPDVLWRSALNQFGIDGSGGVSTKGSFANRHIVPPVVFL